MPLPEPDDNQPASATGFQDRQATFDYDALVAIAAPVRAGLARPSTGLSLPWSAQWLADSLSARLASLLPFGLFLCLFWLAGIPPSLGVSALIIPVVLFRIHVLSLPILDPQASEPPDDDDLPFYSVLVPLYREPEIIEQLIDTLARLDYPAHRREILFLLETDDQATCHALLRSTLPAGFRLVIVQDGDPRTKPRALNEGLRLARGSLIVVYDAEDRPHSNQLRKSAGTFARASDQLACLQAHLVIDNPEAHWLARLFAFEYALQFDALIPRLGNRAWPVTLGGSSNHFRRVLLEQAGGWDAWNVTEDADLGIRFARMGLHVRHLDSDTLEDAPDNLRDWFMQRRRWLKGWLVTAIVHLSEPLRLVRQIGPMQTLLITIQSLGLVLSVLFWPLTLLVVPWLVYASPIPAPLWLIGLLPAAISIPAILVPMLHAGRQRGLTPRLSDVLILPAYFMLVCAAGWMAIAEFITRPAGWNKTPHQPSRTASPPS